MTTKNDFDEGIEKLPMANSRAIRLTPQSFARSSRTLRSTVASTRGRPKGLPLLVPFASVVSHDTNIEHPLDAFSPVSSPLQLAM